MSVVSTDLARVFRAESGRVLAALIGYSKDLSLAEDSLQDACLQAIEQWPERGVPDNKGAWLLAVAKRRLIDRIRRQSHRSNERVLRLVADSFSDAISEEEHDTIPDERLKLIFTCCHPALSEQARVALTLRTLCGLTAREIARAFLTSEVTMNQRLTRAKRKIKNSGIPYEIPEGEGLAERVSSVLAVIYLIYNESYSAYEGQMLTREELAHEAIRLARVLHKLLPRPEVAGLLALLLFHDSRRQARSSDSHSFIPLDKQDRKRWNQEAIAEAHQLLNEAMLSGKPDAYQIQAAISALHAQAPHWEETDWVQIKLLYRALYQLDPSPVVALNQAVALAHSGDLDTAYKSLLALEADLKTYQPFCAACADVAARLDLFEASSEYYERAIHLSKNSSERDFLIARKLELDTRQKRPHNLKLTDPP